MISRHAAALRALPALSTCTNGFITRSENNVTFHRISDAQQPKYIMISYMLRITMCLLLVISLSAAQNETNMLNHILNNTTEHPRLFLKADDEAAWKSRITADPLLKQTQACVIKMANALIDIPVLERKQTGRRLLSISRACIRRVLTLGVAWRLNGDERFLKRAEAELLAVCTFRDWNPSHFLDVGEMLAGVAIGYDWFYHSLSTETRRILKQNMLEKGLHLFSDKQYRWVHKSENNWNQVCHGGMVLGALAVMEDEAELAAHIISSSLNNTHHALQHYAPHGAYPEGPGYWSYGSTFTVLTAAALHSALGEDFGLSSARGFMESSDYYQQVSGPFGLFFNYSDAGRRDGVSPIMYWFARQRNMPSLLWREQQTLKEFVERDIPAMDNEHHRFFPLVLIWAQEFKNITAPTLTNWRGDGVTPIGLHRNGWNSSDIFIGIKGGTPSANHAHMDVGSFVLDAHGERWVYDLGGEHYHRIESQGIKLWGLNQDAERWKLFRLNNLSHNTLVVDGQHQRVDDSGAIIKHNEQHTVVNLSHAYTGQLKQAHRGIALMDDYILVQDDLIGSDKNVSVRWGIATDAEIHIQKQDAVLSKNDKSIRVRIINDNSVDWKIIDIENAGEEYECRNPGFKMLVFNRSVTAAEACSLRVAFYTEAAQDIDLKSLDEW